MDTANESNGKRSSRRKRSYLGLAVALIVVVGAAWVAVDRSGGQDKSQRSGALVIGNAAYTNVVTVAGGNGYGSAANQLAYPAGVAVDGDGNVYVADQYNYRVQRWAPGAIVGVMVAVGYRPTAAPNQPDFTQGVAVDGDGNVYVLDRYKHLVQRWAPGAIVGVTVAGGNGYGSAANQLDSPRGVAVDGDGNVYVSDTDNHRVQKFATTCVGPCEGVTVAGGNGLGSTANQLYSPMGLTVDANRNVYVADTKNHRVQKWSP